MLIENKVTELFYMADDFCNFFDSLIFMHARTTLFIPPSTKSIFPKPRQTYPAGKSCPHPAFIFLY